VSVEGQRMRDATVAHDDERECVAQGELGIGYPHELAEGRVDETAIGANDFDRVALENRFTCSS
jgi:hypothetical protein